ncbi:MAG: hypothetical protein ACO3PB_04600, partial [Miltoncostaeaceae bacterium]
MSVARYVLTLKDELSGPLKGAGDSAHKLAADLSRLSEQAKRLDGDASGLADRFGKIEVSADGTSASIDGLTLSAGRLRAEATKVESETGKLTKGWDRAADALDKLAQSSGLTAEQQRALADRAQRAREEGTRLTDQAREQAATFRRVADATEAAALASKQATAAHANAGKAAEAEAREVAKLTRELDKQVIADEKVRLGKPQAQAVQELRAIAELREELVKRNMIEKEGLDLLERRERQIRENLAIEAGSLARRGVPFQRGMGPRGNVRSPPGQGVFSVRMDEFAASVNKLEDSAGQADSIIAAFAGALSNISPEAAEAARGIGDVAGVLEGLARVGAGKGAAVLGAIAVAVGTVAAAYSTWRRASEAMEDTSGRLNDRIDEGRERMQKYRDAVRETAGAFAQLKIAENEARERIAVLTGEQTQADVDTKARRAEISAQAREGLMASGREVIEARRLVDALKERMRTERQVGEVAARSRKEIADAERVLAEAQSTLNRRKEQAARTADLAELEIFAQDVLATTGDDTGTDTGSSPAARVDEFARSTERLADIARRYEVEQLEGIAAINARYDDQIAAIRELAAATEAATDAERARLQAAQDAAEVQVNAARAAALAREEERRAVEELAAAERARQEQARQAADDARRDAMLIRSGQDIGADLASIATVFEEEQDSRRQAVAQGAVGLATGDLTAIAAAIDPRAGAVAAGLELVGSQGADGVREAGQQAIDLMEAAVAALPEILSEVIPDFAVAITTELVPSLIASGPKILASLIEAIVKIPILIAQAIGQKIRELIDAILPGDQSGNRTPSRAAELTGAVREIASATGRSFRSGTSLIERDGVYQLHQGEAVV